MSSEKRKKSRYQSQAKARIVGLDCGEVLLKDLSILGCRLTSDKHIEVEPSTRFEIEIIPEEIADIGKFEIIAESKWINDKENSAELGFAILESPKGRQFQRYVDYLAWRSKMASSEIQP